MVSLSSTTDLKRKRNIKFILTSTRGSTQHDLMGHMGRLTQSADR